MKKSSRTGRFSARRTPQTTDGSLRRRRAATVAARAGRIGNETPFEALENRQLMFALTIGAADVNPATGLGTVSAEWGYGIPFLSAVIPADMPATPVVEEFQDENAFWTNFNPPAPPSGTTFDQSGIRISYRTQSTSPAILIPFPAPPTAQDRDLQVTLQGDDQMTFAFFTDDQQNPQPRLVLRAQVSIGAGQADGDGLNTSLTDGTRVELLRDGEVVQVLQGTALSSLGQNVVDGIQYTFSLDEGFDAVRFRSTLDTPANVNYFDQFVIDDFILTPPSERFAQLVGARAFGVRAVFTGPVGASVSFFDLFDRPMVNTLDVCALGDNPIPRLDRNGDGVPDFNDGIGRVVIAGSDVNTSLVMFGGTVEEMDGSCVFVHTEDMAGILDDFEQAGFGYIATRDTPPRVIGLPNAGASLVIGAPTVRDPDDYFAPIGPIQSPLPPERFIIPSQGIFVEDGRSVGSVIVHAIVHGSSNFTGSVGRLSTGPLMGSVRVNGDLGELIVNGDAGLWAPDTGANIAEGVRRPFSTNNQLVVGRTVREIAIAGRSNLDVQVLADINNPGRPSLRFARYFEREQVYGIDPATQDGELVTMESIEFSGLNGQASPFGEGTFRNDSLLSAEFVGHNATAVTIAGDLGARDPLNASPDQTDVFAFAADPSREVVVNLLANDLDFGAAFTTLAGQYWRIVDRNGRVLAANDFSDAGAGAAGRGVIGNTARRSVIRFRPEHADVFYLVVNGRVVGNFGAPSSYNVAITGMAPTTFGSFRTGAGAGGTLNLDAAQGNDGAIDEAFVLSLNAGNMGAVRVGTGFYSGAGGEASPAEFVNLAPANDTFFAYGSSTVSVPGNLYNVTAGADIRGGGFEDPVTILVGRNLGSLITGTSPLVGISALQGDISEIELRTGDSIGVLDVRGAMGAIQDPQDTDDRSFNTVSVRTGTSGRRGDIGQILVGAYLAASSTSITTSPGSTIDQFFVGTNNDGDGTEFEGGWIVDATPVVRMGTGSDIRFVDFGIIERPGDANVNFPINIGQSLDFVDDAGAAVRISLRGDPAVSGDSQLLVRVLPIDGSQGVAIARIDATLTGGADVVIEGLTPGVVSIGRIRGATADAGSEILVSGDTTEIDVGRIDIGGNGLTTVSNTTPGGDLVAVDVASLGSLNVSAGDLGRTQTGISGPRLLGPFLNIANTGGGVLGPISLNPAAFDGDEWGGGSYLPVTLGPGFTLPTVLEDIGSPVDAYLNGVIVRSGDLTQVTVAGAVGDVIVPDGHLIGLTANTDDETPFGGFHGIVGNVYAEVIGVVDVGDGLEGTGPSPFAAAGIFAADDILNVVAQRGSPVIRGAIVAANAVQTPRDTIGSGDTPAITDFGVIAGIGVVTLTGGVYDGALITSTSIDDFWNGPRPRGAGLDIPVLRGRVDTVLGTDADFFRSRVEGTSIGVIGMTGGAFDASYVSTSGNIGAVTADEFRNTTRLGDVDERFLSLIRASGDVGSVTTNGQLGDIADLTMDVLGNISGEVSGRNLLRNDFRVANRINSVSATGDIRASSLTSGAVGVVHAGADIRSTTFNVAGPIAEVSAANEITGLDINSTGPDGRVDLVRSGGVLRADINSSGPIGTIESTGSDVVSRIETTDRDGSLALLKAERDLLVDLTLFGNAQAIEAGRNIGLPGDREDRALDIRGNLRDITVGGQIYNDVLVSQDITGTITNGRVSNRPGNDQVSDRRIVAFGRINALDLNGDHNGDIISHSGGIGTVTISRGSLRQGATISAFDGDIDTVRIRGGDLLGDVTADGSIGRIEVLKLGNFTGHIGVASSKSSSDRVGGDPLRNQLPPGTQKTEAVDGPTIRAGRNIGTVLVDRGSIWETTFVAGWSIGTIDVRGSFRNDNRTSGVGSAVVAGDRIENLVVRGSAENIAVVAGAVHLGDDGRAGGVGANADTVREGSIGSVRVAKSALNLRVSAGINAGADGVYNTADDRQVSGTSDIGSVTTGRNPKSVSVFADGSIGPITRGISKREEGKGLQQLDPTRVVSPEAVGSRINSGQSRVFQTDQGYSIRITFSGPGRAFFDRDLTTIRLVDTTLASSLLVEGQDDGEASSSVRLRDLKIRTNNNGSLGVLDVVGEMTGEASAFVDGDVGRMTLRNVNSSGLFGAGGDIEAARFNKLNAGHFEGRMVGSLAVSRDYGKSGKTGEASANVLDLGSLDINNKVSAPISSARDIDSVDVGRIDRGGVRAGRTIGSVTATGLNFARLSAGDRVGDVTVNGNVVRSVVYAGADLGEDAEFGGAGLDADRTTDGVLGDVTVTGNFQSSDLAAGVSRGTDAFLGTADDRADDGRSEIGTVTIRGNQVGSLINSEQYRIVSTGEVGRVRVNNQNFVSRGNFRVDAVEALPVPVLVTDLRVFEDSRIYVAEIAFNQPIDRSTLASALSIQEVRSGGTLIGLAERTDYTVRYDEATRTARITFSRAITDRNLPQQAGVPGPGVFRFNLSGDVLRGESQGVRLDGNGDGATGDSWSEDAVVGDAGDKIVAGNPATRPDIDFYAAVDLNLILDNNYNPDGLPDTNRDITIRGTLGDHPDSDSDAFRAGGDVDLYRITLRAGQILRMSSIGGVAQGAIRALFDSNGEQLAITGAGEFAEGGTVGAIRLPSTIDSQIGVTPEDQYLITGTGTYFIALAANVFDVDIADVNSISDSDPQAGAIGGYSFTVQIFDDGDTGFFGDTDAGNGADVVYAPVPAVFAGPDGVFGTSDDISSFNTRGFSFTLNAGPDGRKNTGDDTVSGTGANGVTSTRTAGNDRLWGTPDDRIFASTTSAIGLPGNSGVPVTLSPDIDVYHLNAGQPINPGTKIRATLRLTETGSNIGLAPERFETTTALDQAVAPFDLLGDVQFALFETNLNTTGFSDALLVAAPSAFLPIGGTPGDSVSDGSTRYGYDESGDFFMEFVVPGAQTVSGTNLPAGYALYIQGAVRSDYTLEILQQGTGTVARSSQNVLLETLGGTIQWLEAGTDISTEILAYTTTVLGFSGQIDGRDVDEYVLSGVIDALNAVFTAANVAINVSSDAADFEGQDFSTVYLAGNTEPNAFFNEFTFGASEKVDMFNADRNDQAVVFLTSMGVLGYENSRAGVDQFIHSLTAAVGRRIGELVGLRMEIPIDTPGSPLPIMAENSVTVVPGPTGTYSFVSTNRTLSGRFDSVDDTNFYLGVQNSGNLLRRILAPRV